MKKTSEELDLLVADHVAYSHNLLVSAGVSPEMLKIFEYTYKEAMKHGYKHGVEDCEDGLLKAIGPGSIVEVNR